MNLTKHPNIALMALACAGAIGSASAGSAHFIKGPTSSISGPTVTETWKESGLGNGDVNYRASANAIARFQCVNRGNQCPQASNKQDVSSPVFTNGSFKVKNGTVTAFLTLGPPGSTLTCPGNQVSQLVRVMYTDIALSDETNGLIDVPAVSDTQTYSSTECP